MNKQKEVSAITFVILLIVFGVVCVGYIFYDKNEKAKQIEQAQKAKASIDNIKNQVASDAVAQYNIAKKQGDKMQICSQAALVSAAYLQAKNETEYNKWKVIESEDCASAGVTK